MKMILQGDEHTASPTVPSPKIATVEPGSTFAVFRTAPLPVSIIITSILGDGKERNSHQRPRQHPI
jgi:hypothetical protein